MSKTLSEIIESVRDGGRPDYEDLRYAICAMEALATFDRNALMRLADAEREGSRPFLVRSAVWQLNEYFGRTKRAGAKPPKEWIGWSNDPDNPEFLERRAAAKRLLERVTGA